MQHYAITDVNLFPQHVDHILRKYPELLLSLNFVNFKRRILRRDTPAQFKRPKKLPSVRLKQLQSALTESMDSYADTIFKCPLCRNLLKLPVTVECGHTFCSDCLEQVISAKCVICDTQLGTLRAINVLVQDLIEKWKERNKNDNWSSVPPNIADVLGIEPRYHLRSGFAGLQISGKNRHEINFGKFNLFQELEHATNKRFNKYLREICREITDIKVKSMKTCWREIPVAELECVLCSRCILDPVTTGCGHTFCRGCLTRVLDHGLSCPLCMSALNLTDYSRGSNIVLDQAIKFFVPKEYSKRLLLDVKEVKSLGKNSELPVFICTNAFPGVACPLYVYEPRYRLLVRRVLQSSARRFAMAAKQNNGEKFVSYGTVLEIKDAISLEDGRILLNTLGTRRFKVINKGEQDGYDMAKIQYIKDTAVATEKLPELIALHQKVYKKASKWIESLTPKVLEEVERLIGEMPKVEKNWISLPDGPFWTWWLMPILPLSSQLQVGFLSTTNLEKRLRAIDKMLEHMKIRMKALEKNTLECSSSEDASESCSDFDVS